MSNKIYPIGIQNFEKIRNDGYFYIDKTALMYQMVKTGSYYFLSRPRRFGKSLLISTLEAYFQGKKELFEGLAVEKLENGMSGFLTQPVLSAQAVENLRKARQTLGERAKILAGIMPVVSQRNAIFMENEINGIHVEEDIIQRFAGLDREQGEALGLEVSMQMAREALPYADGFYLMTPFNRVALMERLIARLKTELLDAEG